MPVFRHKVKDKWRRRSSYFFVVLLLLLKMGWIERQQKARAPRDGRLAARFTKFDQE
jgi:hypothetical protein